MTEKTESSLASKIAQMFAIASAGSLAISIFYNLSYFTFVDIRLVSRLTIQDHIASGIAYLPFLLAFQVLAFGFGVFHALRDEEDLSKIEDKDLLERIKERMKSQKQRDVEYIVIGALSLTLFTFFMGDMYIVSVYALLPMALALYLSYHPISQHINGLGHMVFLLLFSLLVVVFSRAASNAIDDQRQRPARFIIELEKEIIQASALRVFPDSVLYFSSGVPTLVGSESIKRISYPRPLRDLGGRGFCEALNLCLSEQRHKE